MNTMGTAQQSPFDRPSTSHSQPDVRRTESSSSGGNKRVLDPPTTLPDLIYGMSMAVARKILFANTINRAVAYLSLALVLSIASWQIGAMNMPQFYLTQKSNIFNQLFVKLSVAWSLGLLVPFVYLTARVYSGNEMRNMKQQLARLIVATVLWYVCTTAFVNYEQYTGACSLAEFNDSRKLCTSNKGKWSMGFDISGHTFLLIFLSLVISEEATVLRNWDAMRHLLTRPDDSLELRNFGKDRTAEALQLYDEDSTLIKRLFMGLAALVTLWDFELVITLLYYHTLPQKVIASMIGVGCWLVTYRIWYQLPSSPGLPGHGDLPYINYKKSQ